MSCHKPQAAGQQQFHSTLLCLMPVKTREGDIISAHCSAQSMLAGGGDVISTHGSAQSMVVGGNIMTVGACDRDCHLMPAGNQGDKQTGM